MVKVTPLPERENHGGRCSSIKGVVCIIGAVLAMIGGITCWAVLGGQTSALSVYTGIFTVLALLNAFAYRFGWPVMFGMTAAWFFLIGTLLMANADVLRMVEERTTQQKSILGGLIVQFFGVILTFCGINTRRLTPAFSGDLVVAILLNMIMIAGGGLLGNVKQVTLCAQTFWILLLFNLSFFGSRAISLTTLVLSAIACMNLLVPVFATPAPADRTPTTRKQQGGLILVLIGCSLICMYLVFAMSIGRKDRDQFYGEDEISDPDAQSTELPNTNSNVIPEPV